MKTPLYPLFVIFLIVSLVGSFHCQKKETITADGSYQDLVEFFKEWREFEKPNFTNGIPDYTAEAMAEQGRRIPEFENRLTAMDTTDWTLSQKVDYEIVRAEINGLNFNHRVLKPWAKNPRFYAVIQMHEQDVPSREDPEIDGVLNVFQHSFPLNEDSQAVFKKKLKAIPAVLDQAKQNLVEEAGDLWLCGIRQKKGESVDLAALAERLENRHPELADLALEAKSAVDNFRAWLEEKQKGMKSFSGIGKDEYSFYMKKVHLVPYSWEEQLKLIQRELERSLAALKMEEHRNRDLPQLQPARSLKERKKEYKNSVAKFMNFLRNEEIFTVPDYMHLDDEVGSFTPPEQLDRLIKDRAVQLGEDFRLKEFFDEYFSLGMIPASLIRWEMTGLDDQMKKLWD